MLLAHQKGLKSNSLRSIHPVECVVLTATLNDWQVIQHKKLTGCEIRPVTVRDSPSFLDDAEVALMLPVRRGRQLNFPSAVSKSAPPG